MKKSMKENINMGLIQRASMVLWKLFIQQTLELLFPLAHVLLKSFTFRIETILVDPTYGPDYLSYIIHELP